MTKRQQARDIWQQAFQTLIHRLAIEQAIEAADKAVAAFLANKKL